MKTKIVVALLIGTLSIFSHAKEDDQLPALIAGITEAYGGDAIINLKSYALDDRILSTSLGQEWHPDLDEVTNFNQVLKVDLAGNRSRLETWADGRGGVFQNATISDGETAYNINYRSMTYGAAPSADVYTFAGGFMRTTDSVLVYELIKAADQARYDGEVLYMNRPHVKIVMPFPQSPELTLFIDKETHLVSKMERTTQFGHLDYVFSDYEKVGGVTHARIFRFFVQGDPNLISKTHKAEFNVEFSDVEFAIPDNLAEEGERVDVSEMLVNKISDRVYHIGQNNGFSIFADTSDGIVAAGGYPALTDRFDRFKEETGVHKPLNYQVVTHHHNDHLGGLGEAVALGAKLVTVTDNVQTIKDAIAPAPEDWRFMTVGKRTTLGEGRDRVEIFEVSTIHAASYLIVYVPSERTIFIADHLGSPYATGVPVANLNTTSMLAALESLDLDVRRIATAHNGRIFSFKDLTDSVAAYADFSCAADRPVCM